MGPLRSGPRCGTDGLGQYKTYDMSSPHGMARVDVRREGSLPSLALPCVWEGQALAARVLPLQSENIEIFILASKI